MNKFLSSSLFLLGTLLCIGTAHAQAEQQLKTELQKKLGANAKVRSVSPSPVTGLYEVLVGNDVLYSDSSGKYLIQGEIIELATGKNITEQKQADINRIKWADLTTANSIKTVRGNGSRQYHSIQRPCRRHAVPLPPHTHTHTPTVDSPV